MLVILNIRHHILVDKMLCVFRQFIGGMCQKNQSIVENMIRFDTNLYMKKEHNIIYVLAGMMWVLCLIFI